MSIGGYTFLFDVDEAPRKNVFFDPTARRRDRVTSVLRAGAVLVVLWGALFFAGTVPLASVVEELGFLARAKLGWLAAGPDAGVASDAAHDHGAAPTPAGGGALRPTLADHHLAPAAASCATPPAPVMAAIADAAPVRRIYGHMPGALENAELSLPLSCDTLDVLMPDWIGLTLGGGRAVVSVAPDDMREAGQDYRAARRGAVALLPVVTLVVGVDAAGDDLPGQERPAAAALLDPAIANVALRDLAEAATALDAAGACLDATGLGDDDIAGLVPFFQRFQRSFHRAGLESCLVLPGDGAAWTDRRLTAGLDRIVLQLFKRGWVGSAPGPVADTAWFEATASRARALIGPDRLVVALGSFAETWIAGQPLPDIRPYGAALHEAGAAGGAVRFGAEAGNAFAAWTGDDGRRRRAWILDAVSAHNQLRVLDRLGLAQVAVWSLGTEDPSLWPLLATDLSAPDRVRDALGEVRLATWVHYTGEGPFLKVRGRPETGQRDLAFSQHDGHIVDAAFARLPRAYEIERYGMPGEGRLVLTFDDGPDPLYTAQILDILRDTGVPGAFFVVGARAMQEPELLVRMVEEGHEIGSHSFSHPRMDHISRSRGAFEHSMMHKLIGGYSGRDTRLYREPFLRGGGPLEEARVAPLAAAQADGAVIVGMDIVPRDWDGLRAQEIVDHVLAEVDRGAGQVLLFHDGGGNRAETVKALPVLIDALRARGYSFSSLAELIGTDRATLMPVSDAPWPGLDKASFDVMSGTKTGLVTLFWAVLALGLARSLFILVLVVKHRRIPPIHSHERPRVAVVVPAYNEQEAVGNCIRTLLRSTYDNFEVIVVDDGSTDDTFEEVQKLSTDRRVRLFAQFNHGKWGALNAAIRNTDAEILVCIDADTQVRPDALGHLVKHFANPRVGAVAGKVVVGNRVNLLTRLQALEYITAQNFERRAHDMLNSMLVVPGALGAWRRQALIDAGLYSADTVTEDADMTVAVGRAGYRITYEDHAVAFTEVPETVKLLLSQRLRWSFGMFQTAWKHKGALRDRAPQGLVSIPDLVIFGYLYAMLAPVADALLVMFLATRAFGGGEALVAGGGLVTLGPVVFAYLALPLFELFVAGYALRADKRESLWMLLLFPFQRFFYRQLLYLSVLRALSRALMGSFTGWGIKKRMRRDMLAMQDA